MPDLTPLLEAAAADLLEDFALTYAPLRPEAGVEARRFGLAVACAAGPGNPLSTVKGLGPSLSPRSLDELEDFYRAKGLAPAFEVAPWMNASSLALLSQRGYQVVAEEDVMLRSTADPLAGEAETGCPRDEWARAVSEGFFGPDAGRWLDLGVAMAALPGAELFVRRVDGEIAAAAQAVRGLRVATFACDVTREAFRGRGLQQALIAARVRCAAAWGSQWCTSEVAPGGASQRNYERCGFAKVYTRQHWKKSMNS